MKDSQGNAYDIEMQRGKSDHLAKRSRYYHSQMDSYQIQKGAKYAELKKNIVIFVCTFDYVGAGKSVYTFQNRCNELPEVVLEDEVTTVFINLAGERQGLDENLVSLLNFMEKNEVTDEYTHTIAQKVQAIRGDDEWREEYMTLEMKFDEIREQGREEGIKEGRREGKKEGIEEGRREGKKEGIEEGTQIYFIDMVCRKMKKGKDAFWIAEELEENIEKVEKIYTIAKKYAPEYNVQKIYEQLHISKK